MSKIQALVTAISSRKGRAATAIVLILNASTAYAQGDVKLGRQLTKRALTVQARICDEPQDDTVLTVEEREQLRKIADEIRQARTGKGDMANAAAVDLISVAGMVSKRRADADAMMRSIITLTKKQPTSEDIDSAFRDLGFPIRLDGSSTSNIKFEPI